MKKRVLWVVAYVAAIAVFVAGVAVLVRHQRADDGDAAAGAAAAGTLPELAAMPFPATIDSSVAVAGTQVGTSVGLTVGGYSGAGVVAVELYDGDRLVGTVTPPGGGETADVTFPALTPGTHPLSAQVTDGDGQVALTPVLSVPVVESTMTSDLPVPVTPQEGETPSAMAERLGIEPDQVHATAPDAVAPAPDRVAPTVPLDAVIPPGSVVVAVVRPDQPAAPEPPAVDGADLAATVDGCDVTLAGATGDTFEGTGVGWAHVDGSSSNGALVVAGAAPGTHTYMVRGDAGAPLARARVVVPDACAEGSGWTGNASIVDGVLHLPTEAAGSVWLYLTVDGVTGRAPVSQDASFVASRETPVAGMLPPLAGRRLVLEVWRATGDVGSTKVAEGRLDVGAGHDVSEVVGEPTGLTLGVRTGGSGPFGRWVDMGTQDGEATFHWEASSARATQVMWQVLVGDPGTGAANPAPVGLLAAGISTASGPATDLGGNAGEFTIDTADIAGRDATGAQAAYAALARRLRSVDVPVTLAMVSVTADEPTARPTIGQVGAGSFARPVAPTTPRSIDPTVRAVQLPTYGDQVYVRVIPLDATDAVLPGPASNAVGVKLPVPQGLDGTTVDFTIDSVTFDAGRLTHADLTRCVRVDVPWNVTGPGNPALNIAPAGTPPPGGWTFSQQVLSAFYPTDGAYCHKPPPSGCDDVLCWLADKASAVVSALVSLATAIYEGVSTVYNGIINTVVDLVAGGLCGPLAAVAGDSVDGTCQDVMRTVTRAAISAVLAAYGIPPSLPSVDELKAVASGELDVLAVELMKQFGVPCDEMATADPGDAAALAEAAGVDGDVGAAAADPCRALARAVLDQAQAQVTDLLNTQVAQAQGFPSLAGVPGASMVPEPTGQATPISVQMETHATQANAEVAGLVCRAGAQFSSYPFFIAPYTDVPLVNPPPPGSYRYPFTLSGPSATASLGSWSGGVGVADFRPESGAYINEQDPMTVEVRLSGPCQSPSRSVTTAMRPPDPRPPVRQI